MFLLDLIGKLMFAFGALVAVFVVAWYFHIHDHAARTEGGIAQSVQSRFDADRVTCRERKGGWRCVLTSGDSDEESLFVVPRGTKNCWRVRGEDAGGCVRVTDYLVGLL